MQFSSEHAIYISVVEIYPSEVKVKVFTDDLISAIRNSNANLKQSTEEEFCSANQRLIESYFKSKLKIKVNGTPVSLTYRNSILEGDSYWISFNSNAATDWKTVQVEDTHFLELFPTQSNIVKLTGSKQRFCKLSKGTTNCSFEF